jgi:hypothetical protein
MRPQLPYEPPVIRSVGSLYDLTRGDPVRTNSSGKFCIWNKTIGPPDYVQWIPVTNCS